MIKIIDDLDYKAKRYAIKWWSHKDDDTKNAIRLAFLAGYNSRGVTYTYDNMMDIAGWMAAADCNRPVDELKQEAEEYISRINKEKIN